MNDLLATALGTLRGCKGKANAAAQDYNSATDGDEDTGNALTLESAQPSAT